MLARAQTFIALTAVCLLLPGCRSGPGHQPAARAPDPPGPPAIGGELVRRGQEMMVAGRLFHVGAPVVLWTDPGGYDAYRVEDRFGPWAEAGWDGSRARAGVTPNRYGLRFAEGLGPEALARARGGGWRLEELREVVDQFVIHYDAAGTSRQCFKVLHDLRGLSVHFMLDIDGTIYQTLDVKERAWHATKSNDRSIGIEIASIGAYPPDQAAGVFAQWYSMDAVGAAGGVGARIDPPQWMGDGGVRTAGFVGRPARRGPISGEIHGQELLMHDLTPEQYESLTRLTAALCVVFPGIACDAPRGPDGVVLTRALDDDEWRSFSGVLGHYHVQGNKIDPGPAFDWERVIGGARALLGSAVEE